MKCVCGYEYKPTMETSYQDDFKYKFKEINVQMFIDEDDYQTFFFCPKCGTLKIDI
jgi:hypothetical protein